ncbi:hypothetical protein LCGC14_0350010 [marine sediment metagenome]|uniref:RNA polymerase sigma-70 region 4 domain-containing protein n=1 Tax=marine sediment metagenome TaxID=412755 RepID=A0A0F9TGT4_9ZZZZ
MDKKDRSLMFQAIAGTVGRNREIRRLHFEKGKSIPEIARMYKMSRQAIWVICTREE